MKMRVSHAQCVRVESSAICRVMAETKWPPIQSNGKDSLKIMERSFIKASKSI